MDKLSQKLRSLREKEGLSLEETGRQVGIHRATLCRYESGELPGINHENIISIRKLFNITPNELFDWEEETKREGPSESYADEIARLKETAETIAQCTTGFMQQILQQVNELCERLGKE